MRSPCLRVTAPSLVAVGWLLAVFVPPALACDTPVYRYAMYRWEPAPYEIYYFHDSPAEGSVAEFHAKVAQASEEEAQPANVILIPVPVKDDPELKRIPPDVRRIWTDQESPTLPCYLIVTPHGGLLHKGEFELAKFQLLIDSPVRRQVAAQLEQGKAGVMVMLTGSDPAANDEAEKEVQGLLKDIGEGKIELYLPPAMVFPGEEGEPKPPPIDLGFCKVERTSEPERWFVESLLAIEPDLKDAEFADKPMIFCVFGRGRALPPFIGKGINRDNLLNCVDFITGACSCTVKDQNPGMDLLIAKDWWTVAETLSSQFGSEEGNEPQLGAADLFPDLTIPGAAAAEMEAGDAASDDGQTPPAAAAVGSEPETGAGTVAAGERGTDPPAGGATAAVVPPAVEPSGNSAAPAADAADATIPDSAAADRGTGSGPESSAAAPREPAPEGPEAAVGAGETERTVAAVEGKPHRDDAASADHGAGPPAQSFGSVIAVGSGLAIALLLLLGATFVVLRPQ